MLSCSGGKLWDHISKYVCQAVAPPSSPIDGASEGALTCSPRKEVFNSNIYCGRRLLLDPCQDALDYQKEIGSQKAAKGSAKGKDVQKTPERKKTIKSCLSEKNSAATGKVLTFKSDDESINDVRSDRLLKVVPHQFRDSVESPSTHDPRSGWDPQSTCDPTTYDATSMFSDSKFTTEDNHLVAHSGMARYKRIDTSSCASDTTVGVDWGDSEIDDSMPDMGKQETKQVLFEDDCNIADTISERQQWSHANEVSLTSERQTKTTPIVCLGKSELNLFGDLEFYGNPHVCKSLSAEDLSVHSMSANNIEMLQHSTISTINIIPFAQKTRSGAVKPKKEDGDNISIGSDTLSGVSDDFSCSVSINQLSEDKKNIGLQSELNLISECAVSDGRKRPPTTPDSAYAFLNVSDRGALKSLCQSTSADITVDVTTMENTLENNSMCNATLNDNITSDVFHSAMKSISKDINLEKLVSIDSGKSSPKSKTFQESNLPQDKETCNPPSKKLLKSNSDELSLEKAEKKAEEERCPSEPISLSSITLPSFSASQIADRSGSEVASFDIEELIRNSRRLLHNVDLTLEQSKIKSGVRPVPSEDSSTSIDQSELPLDSVSVGFDTPDIPSNSTRCSNVSSDNHLHSKVMADNTYSSIPSIALDTSRHALNNENSAASMDKALRSPRRLELIAKSSQPSSNDSFNSCQDNVSKSSPVNNEEKVPCPFLSLPKDSVTSKEDSTNPSDIHTQIHLSSGGADEKDEEGEQRPRLPVLERQDNFEKSDTTKSSFKNNVVDKVMKTIGITKLSNESSPLSNDSTSISGITLNNSESPDACPSLSNSTRQSSSILSQSATPVDGQFSSESTSGLKYCPNPEDKTNLLSKNPDPAVSKTSHKHKPDQALSEPLYLLPERDRTEFLNKSESALYCRKKEIAPRVDGSDNYITASDDADKNDGTMHKDVEPLTDTSLLYTCNSKQENDILTSREETDTFTVSTNVDSNSSTDYKCTADFSTVSTTSTSFLHQSGSSILTLDDCNTPVAVAFNNTCEKTSYGRTKDKVIEEFKN